MTSDDPGASELETLRAALAEAEGALAREKAARARSRKRMQRKATRERESLEAHLSKLVTEMGELRHLAERSARLEAELRKRQAGFAEREAQLVARAAELGTLLEAADQRERALRAELEARALLVRAVTPDRPQAISAAPAPTGSPCSHGAGGAAQPRSNPGRLAARAGGASRTSGGSSDGGARSAS